MVAGCPACAILTGWHSWYVCGVSACRRGLRKAWWQLVDDVQAAAEAAARQAEVHAWKTKGAAVKVRGWEGESVFGAAVARLN